MRWDIFWFGICAILLISVMPVSADDINPDLISEDNYASGSLDLAEGWNYISIPRRLSEGSDTAAGFSGIQTAGRSIWTYNPENGGWKDLSAEDRITPLEGYWIYSEVPMKVPLSFTIDPLQVPPVKDLALGWNMVGLSGTYSASARDTLLSIRKSWTEVIGWDNNAQRFETTIINGGDGVMADNRELLPYHAYWVYVTEPCTLASIGA